MRIALVSTGLGRVRRGFEAFTGSLFEALRQHAPGADVVLFKGGGTPGERCSVVPNLHRYDAPSRWLGYRRANLLEKRSFALALYPLLRSGGFDLVHYNEVTMGSALYHLRRILGGSFKLLYCDGGGAPPMHWRHRCDYAQLLTGPAHRLAIDEGVPAGRLFLVPYGLDGRGFRPRGCEERRQVREQLGIPDNARVVLTVAALDRETKRIDHVIREAALLDLPVWLLAAGQVTADTPGLEALAGRELPDRCRFVSWPHERLPLLYAAADVFCLASLREAFGLVTVEAMLSGLPVVVHDAPVFRWLAGGSSVRCVDMAAAGALSRELAEILAGPAVPSAREEALRRFSWEHLIPEYLRMYARAGVAPARAPHPAPVGSGGGNVG